MISQKLFEKLARDELFDLCLYEKLLRLSSGELAEFLEELIKTERKHLFFWEKKAGTKTKLSLGLWVKLWVIYFFAFVFREPAVRLIIESVEIYGIKKYLYLWERCADEPRIREELKDIIDDELLHEDQAAVQVIEKKISGDRIRNIFLGLNDGLVEILGAVSGFFAVFDKPISIMMAGLTVAVAGAISMGAGVFVAESSEKEVEEREKKRHQYLGKEYNNHLGRPWVSSVLVGAFYFIGALFSLLPVFFGAKNILVPFIVAGGVMIFTSFVVAFLSGMDLKKRIFTNLFIMSLAVVITYTIGSFAKDYLGIII